MQKGILHHRSQSEINGATSSVDEIRDIARTIGMLDANPADVKKELNVLEEGLKEIQHTHSVTGAMEGISKRHQHTSSTAITGLAGVATKTVRPTTNYHVFVISS